MTTLRKEGWEARLPAFIASKATTRFEWGHHDCCTFAAGALDAVTGIEATAKHGEYSSPIGAARVLKAAGGITSIPELHGLQPLASVRLAQRGDIVGAETLRRDGRKLLSLGVCIGQMSAFPGPVGVSTRPTLECVRAWRVA